MRSPLPTRAESDVWSAGERRVAPGGVNKGVRGGTVSEVRPTAETSRIERSCPQRSPTAPRSAWASRAGSRSPREHPALCSRTGNASHSCRGILLRVFVQALLEKLKISSLLVGGRWVDDR